MDSSNVFGEAEECHSSESGWTMYIGSPSNDDDDDDGDVHDDHTADRIRASHEDKHHKNNMISTANNDDSDDSMASDASSGPSHREKPWDLEGSGRGRGRGRGRDTSDKKSLFKMDDEEKKDSNFTGKEAKGSLMRGKKLRAKSWISKRK